jgi:hypothetical protein
MQPVSDRREDAALIPLFFLFSFQSDALKPSMFQRAERIQRFRVMYPRLSVKEVRTFIKSPEISFSLEAVHFVAELHVPAGVIPKASDGTVDFTFVEPFQYYLYIHRPLSSTPPKPWSRIRTNRGVVIIRRDRVESGPDKWRVNQQTVPKSRVKSTDTENFFSRRVAFGNWYRRFRHDLYQKTKGHVLTHSNRNYGSSVIYTTKL